jgi:hypothetical protein
VSTSEMQSQPTEGPSFGLDWICAQIDQGYTLSFIAKSLGYKRAQLWTWIDACPDRQRLIRKKLKGRPHPTPEQRDLMRAELSVLRLKVDAQSWLERCRKLSGPANTLNVPPVHAPAHARQEGEPQP